MFRTGKAKPLSISAGKRKRKEPIIACCWVVDMVDMSSPTPKVVKRKRTDPIRHFMEVVRGIFLKGVGLSILWPQVLMLFILGTALIVLSALRFQKRVE